MTFTYSLSTDRGKVRLELGDADITAGVKPDNSNFTDAEIDYFLDEESTVQRAVARACEALSRIWANQANLTVGPRREELAAVAAAWANRAKELRAQHGGNMTITVAGVIPKDGYSDDTANDDIEDAGGEYGDRTVYIRV